MKDYYKVRVSNLDILAMDSGLSKTAFRVFSYLCSIVDNGNTVATCVDEVMSRLNLDKTLVSKAVSELEEGLLIKVEKKYQGDRIILVHPEYAWKGDYSLQGVALKKWIREVCRPKWGSLLKDTEVFLSKQ